MYNYQHFSQLFLVFWSGRITMFKWSPWYLCNYISFSLDSIALKLHMLVLNCDECYVWFIYLFILFHFSFSSFHKRGGQYCFWGWQQYDNKYVRIKLRRHISLIFNAVDLHDNVYASNAHPPARTYCRFWQESDRIN